VHPRHRTDGFFRVVAQVEAEVAEIVSGVAGMPLDRMPTGAGRAMAESSWAFRADTIYERIAVQLLTDDGPGDLMAVYFGVPDVVGHRFWPLARPARGLGRALTEPAVGGLFGLPFWKQLQLDASSEWAHVIFRSYERVDAAIGRLIQAFPRESTIVVLSDHGMRPWGHPDGIPGFFLAAGKNIRRMPTPHPRELQRGHLRRIGSVLDVTPTLLTLLEIPVGLDMDGRAMEAILEPLNPGRPRPTPLASHDTVEWLALRGSQTPFDRQDPERLEQLRALGYIQ
jgi:hypothetical protein